MAASLWRGGGGKMKAKASLLSLRKVVIGVTKEGKYFILMSDPYVKRAIELCYQAGANFTDVKQTIEEAYKEAKNEKEG